MTKIDVVTALQEEIDAFSLSLFEALRGLRDVSTGSTSQPQTQKQQSNEEVASNNQGKRLIGSPGKSLTINGDEDLDIVKALASSALEKSVNIETLLNQIPGLNRTRTEQLKIIEELIKENNLVEKELQIMLRLANDRNEQIYQVMQNETYLALGVEVENDN